MDDKDKKINNENLKDEENKFSENDKTKLTNEKEDLEAEVIEKIVSELEEKYNLKKENIKIVKVKKLSTKQRISRMVFKEIMFWLFDFLLIIALHGYFSFPESNILKLLLFSIVFYIIEMAGRTIINKYFRKLVLYSFGTIMLPITITALFLAQKLTEVELIEDILLFIIVFIGVRIILRFVLMRKEILSLIKGRKK